MNLRLTPADISFEFQPLDLEMAPINLGLPILRYRAEYAEQAYKLCRLGLDDSGLAEFFDVSTITIRDWAEMHDAFDDAIKRGRIEANANVGHALYRRAVGYDATESRVSICQGKFTRTETTRHVPPCEKACVAWLSSRMPEQWLNKK